MNRTRKPNHALTAADVMSRNPVTVHHRVTLRTAAQILGRRRAHVLPVTDHQGKFVGLLSAADLLRWALDDGPGGGQAPDTSAWTDWQLVAPGAGMTDEVRWHLTADPAVVSPADCLADVARKMRDSSACCAVVTDQEGLPVGLVSGADLMAAGPVMAEQPGVDPPTLGPAAGRRLARRAPAQPAL